jgi:hypothetical protein
MRVKPWLKWSIVTLVVGATAFVLTPLWPVPPTAPQPPSNLLPFFILLSFVESVSFGLGVAFLIFGRGLLGRLGRSPRLTTAAYLAVAFLLVNWWPHDNLHRMTSGDWMRLVLVEYGFHLPLMLAGAVLAWFFVSLARPASASERSPARPTKAATGLDEVSG